MKDIKKILIPVGIILAGFIFYLLCFYKIYDNTINDIRYEVSILGKMKITGEGMA